MTHIPSISICIPLYNNNKGLLRLLDSIEIQTFKDFEVIITDDSNEEFSFDLLKKYSFYTKIHYYFNSIKLGAPENWNKSLELSSGIYIKIMHHDDWFSNENSLKLFIDLLKDNPNTSLGFSGTNQIYLDNSNKDFSRHITTQELKMLSEDYRYLFIGNYIGGPSSVIFKKNSALFDLKLKWLVDVDFYLQILEQNANFKFTLEPLVSIGLSNNQLTQSCITNQTLNIFEYSFIYLKMCLYRKSFCKKKMYKVLISNNARFKDYKNVKISYFPVLFKKFVTKISRIKTKIIETFRGINVCC